MTIYNRYLIAFMKAKARKLKPYTDISYFTKADAKAIEKWTKAKTVWKALRQRILDVDVEGLFDTTCPFCLYYDDEDNLYGERCWCCTYGKEHGVCGSNYADNDFYKIIKTAFAGNIYTSNDIFNSDFYKKLIKRIEKNVR